MASPGHRNPKGAARAPIAPPQFSPDDLQAFHQNHFSTDAIAHFNLTFLKPSDASQAQHADDFIDDDDDGLGYYEDGVKRTLTDEQIAMFRHSEIEALRRQLHKRPAPEHKDDADMEATEVKDEEPQPRDQVAAASTKKNNSNKKRKGHNGRQQEPKPDLRKRTWDVVDTGLDSLDYD